MRFKNSKATETLTVPRTQLYTYKLLKIVQINLGVFVCISVEDMRGIFGK
jgi:hypothetical protein